MNSPLVFQKYNHFVYQNGTSEIFATPTLSPEIHDMQFAYNEDPKYDINAAFVRLHDLLIKKFLPDHYYSISTPSILFYLCEDVGFASNTSLSKDFFEKFVLQANVPDSQLAFTVPFFYFGDCRFLLHSLQNTLIANNEFFVQYFIELAEIVPYDSATQAFGEHICMSDYRSYRIMASLELYFIKAYSVLDLFCKFIAELESPSLTKVKYGSTDNYKKLWKEKKKLKINNTPGTIFEKCKLITTIESLRNSFVHDGSWENYPTVHINYAGQQISERFMLFPDITAEGHLVKFGNRKLFFDQGQKVNDVLPEIHFEFAKRVIKTVEVIEEMYFTEQ